MTITTRRRILLVGVPLLAVLAGIVVWATGGQQIETDNAYLKSDLVPIHPEVDAQVTEVLVEENAVVERGQPVVRLDVASLKIELERADAHLATVRETCSRSNASFGNAATNCRWPRSSAASPSGS